jgi:hypothetical protein
VRVVIRKRNIRQLFSSVDLHVYTTHVVVVSNAMGINPEQPCQDGGVFRVHDPSLQLQSQFFECHDLHEKFTVSSLDEVSFAE